MTTPDAHERTGLGQTGLGQTGHGQTGHGQTGHGQTGHGQTGLVFPRGCAGRATVAVLSAWSLLVFVVFLIAFPTTYLPWPPSSPGELAVLLGTCQMLAIGALLSAGSLLWALARPRWVERALSSGVRRAVAATGTFVLGSGVTLLIAAMAFGLPIVWIVAALNIASGIGLLRGAGQMSANIR